MKNPQVLDLSQHDRDLTIKGFEQFSSDHDKTIY